MTRITYLVYLIFTFLIGTSTAYAQSNCDAPQYRQFDFWLGEWKVTTPDGKLAGHNTITLSHGNCVLSEHYITPTGFEGNSFNIFDRQNGKWHQTWVDNTGLLLKISGGMKNGAMVLTGEGKAPDGSPLLHRITWTPNPDKTVSQHWQTSKDNGETWNRAFLGRYTKIKQ